MKQNMNERTHTGNYFGFDLNVITPRLHSTRCPSVGCCTFILLGAAILHAVLPVHQYGKSIILIFLPQVALYEVPINDVQQHIYFF